MNKKILLVRVNCPSRASAELIGNYMLEKKLAPCINIGPAVDSLYLWEGEKRQAQEWLLWLKVMARNWTTLLSEISDLHPDHSPAILGLPILDCSEAYALWLHQESADG